MNLSTTLRTTFVAVILTLLASEGIAGARGVSPPDATAEQRETAQKEFVRGKDLYGAKNYDGAVAALTASLEAVSSPNARLVLARCYRDMGRLGAAHRELTRTVNDARALASHDAKYQKTADAAQEERSELESRLGFVQIGIAHDTPTTTVKVGGEAIPREEWSEPIAVSPGAVEVVAETPGRPPVSKNVEVGAGGKASVALDAGGEAPLASEPAPPPPEPKQESSSLRPYAYVAGAVGVAGLATFAVAGLMSNATYSDLERDCGNGPCPPGHEDDISAGKTQQTIANIGLVVGAVGIAAAATLFVLSPSSSSTSSPGAAARGPRARIAAGPTFLSVHGSF